MYFGQTVLKSKPNCQGKINNISQSTLTLHLYSNGLNLGYRQVVLMLLISSIPLKNEFNDIYYQLIPKDRNTGAPNLPLEKPICRSESNS